MKKSMFMLFSKQVKRKVYFLVKHIQENSMKIS